MPGRIPLPAPLRADKTLYAHLPFSGVLKLLLDTMYASKSACYVKLVNRRTEDSVSVTVTVESDMELVPDHKSNEDPAFPADAELFRALGAACSMYDEDDTVNPDALYRSTSHVEFFFAPTRLI